MEVIMEVIIIVTLLLVVGALGITIFKYPSSGGKYM